MSDNFKCPYCLIDKSVKDVGGTLDKNIEQLILKRTIWEEELAKLTTSQITTNDSELKARLDKDIARTQQDLKVIYQQIKDSKEIVCKSCWKKFENKEIETFNCIVCKENITGKKLSGHIENYQDEGISVRKWVDFCQPCKDTRIIEANIYCPRKGDGRDGDWDVDRPLFDCACPIPEEKEIK